VRATGASAAGGIVTDRGDETTTRVELRLPHASSAAELGRRAVERSLRGTIPAQRLDEVKLMCDELVANAVLHARPERDGAVGLRIEVLADRVRIVVTDGSPQFEWSTRASAELAGGFGLVLVDRLADRWGLSRGEQKAVWFEVDCPGRSAAVVESPALE
jgi:anti-sigma regulatory factor (Ser/Thr protein kinase)